MFTRETMRDHAYMTEHRPGRKFFVRVPGPEARERFDLLGPAETNDAYGYGKTEEEAFENAIKMFDRKQSLAKVENPQGSLFMVGVGAPA